MTNSRPHLKWQKSELWLFTIPALVLALCFLFNAYDKSPQVRRSRTQKLIEAVTEADLQTTISLLNKGADPNAKNPQGRSLLEAAIAIKPPDIAQALLKAGANANVKTQNGASLLALAIILRQDYAIVEALLEKGLDPNEIITNHYNQKSEREPLLIRAIRSYGTAPAIFSTLLSHGANPDAKNSAGFNALEIAISLDHIDAVRTLLRLGANPNQKNKFGIPPIMAACRNGTGEGRIIVGLLLAKGADVNTTDGDGNTALMEAARNDNSATLQLLLDQGADLNQRAHDGSTVLQASIPNSYVQVIKFILDQNVDINAQDNHGHTALMTVNSYILGGAKEDFQNRLQVTQLLLNRGAKVNIADTDGKTALDWAIDFAEDPAIAHLLRANGAKRGRNLDRK